MGQKFAVILLIVAGLFAVPCWGDAIFYSPDASCNPTITTPASGGCTWENFSANTDNTITAGSSFTNYYVAAPNPLWTITTADYTYFRVLDGGHQGDVFTLYDNSVALGQTSPTAIDANHVCANDLSGFPGNDPAACWNDNLMSRGIFLLAPGSHSLTVTWDQRVPGGNSTLQWFEIGVAPAPGVPEPGSVFLIGSGLAALLFTRYRKGSRT